MENTGVTTGTYLCRFVAFRFAHCRDDPSQATTTLMAPRSPDRRSHFFASIKPMLLAFRRAVASYWLDEDHLEPAAVYKLSGDPALSRHVTLLLVRIAQYVLHRDARVLRLPRTQGSSSVCPSNRDAGALLGLKIRAVDDFQEQNYVCGSVHDTEIRNALCEYGCNHQLECTGHGNKAFLASRSFSNCGKPT
jgi:hypothetical protein